MRNKEIKALAHYFAIHWAATVLDPTTRRIERGAMADFGLVNRNGPLSLTPSGEKVIAYIQTQDHKKPSFSRTSRKQRRKAR